MKILRRDPERLTIGTRLSWAWLGGAFVAGQGLLLTGAGMGDVGLLVTLSGLAVAGMMGVRDRLVLDRARGFVEQRRTILAGPGWRVRRVPLAEVVGAHAWHDTSGDNACDRVALRLADGEEWTPDMDLGLSSDDDSEQEVAAAIQAFLAG